MLSAILSIGRDDNLLYYLSSIIGLFGILFIMLLVKSKVFFKFNNIDLIFLIIISLFIAFGLFFRFEAMGIIYRFV